VLLTVTADSKHSFSKIKFTLLQSPHTVLKLILLFFWVLSSICKTKIYQNSEQCHHPHHRENLKSHMFPNLKHVTTCLVLSGTFGIDSHLTYQVQSELFISFAVVYCCYGRNFAGKWASRYAQIKHGSTVLESQRHTILSRSPYLMLITNTKLWNIP
jgi:hypothetical protein